MNLAWWLEHSRSERGDAVACIDAEGSTHTYAQIHDLSGRLARLLKDRGVHEGDVVVSLARESALHMSLFFAVLRVGAVFSAFNVQSPAAKLAGDARRCEARWLVAAPEFADLATEVATADGVTLEPLLALGAGFPGVDDLLDAARSVVPLREMTPRMEAEAAAINFTAGTSGNAKGVLFTHGTLQNSALGAMFTSGLGSRTVNLSLIGMHHSGGLHDVIKLVMAGGAIVWSGGWDVDRVVAMIREHRPNWIFFIVPTMVRDLMRHASWDELDLSGTGMYVAGEPVPPDVATALQGKGARFCNAYGMTETMPFRITGPEGGMEGAHLSPPGSSGKPSKEFCEVVIKDLFTQQPITEPGMVGEICVRGDNVTPGYVNDLEKTADLFDDEGFLHTKDLGRFDEAGWFYLEGRVDDIINSGGEKLSLLEVDNCLLKHPRVADAACTGVAHERFGSVPAAFVVWDGQVAEENEAELVSQLDEFVTANLERWKRPRLYIFTDSVPRNEVKRSKSLAQMKAVVGDVRLGANDPVLPLSAVRAGRR